MLRPRRLDAKSLCMGRRVLLVLVLISGAVSVTFVLNRRAPHYGGKSLSQWLEIYRNGTSQHAFTSEETRERERAAEAVRSIGTNGLAHLIDQISYQPSTFETRLEHLVDKIPGVSSLTSIQRRYLEANAAVTAFEILGPVADPAIPALQQLASNYRRHRTATQATSALVAIGSHAIPAILSLLTNQHPETRIIALDEIAGLGEKASITVPIIVQCLKCTNSAVRESAAAALGSLAIEPETSIPALRESLADPVTRVQFRAVFALGQFGSQARDVVPYLIGLLEGDDENLHSAVTNAVRKIESKEH
jgi:hypothetical protein